VCDYYHIGEFFPDELRRFDAVHVRHPTIHHDSMGAKLTYEVDGLTPVLGLSQDVDVLAIPQGASKHMTHLVTVVCYYDPDRRHGGHGCASVWAIATFDHGNLEAF